MRCKVTVVGGSEGASLTALLLAQGDLAELVLVGARPGVADDLRAAAPLLGYEPRVRDGGWEDAAGSDVVVLLGVDGHTATELARRCGRAVVVVATPDTATDVGSLLERARLPRGRVLGVAVDRGEGHGPVLLAAGAVRMADHVLRDRRRVVDAYVLCRPDDGTPPGDEVRRVEVRVGANGAEEILGQDAP